MKTKKFLLPSIFLAITILIYIVATFVFCYTTKPEIVKGSFPFSITYEYKGAINTLSGIYKCEYSGSKTILIAVRRDKEYKYSKLDKASIIFNFLVGIFAVPFISVICILFGIVESSIELINQIIYSIPPFAILCLALSVVLRRKGISKTGFYIQFLGILPFILILVLDAICSFC